MAVIGIDLGTTYCSAGILVDGKPRIIRLEGEPTMPSVVRLQKSGKIFVGKSAKAGRADDPQNTLIEVKRKLGQGDDQGRDLTFQLGDKAFKPQEISAMLLRQIKDSAEAELGEPITGVVLSCPACFDDLQRFTLKEAGQIAGLNVLRIINEPTAAAYAYGVAEDDSEKEKLLIVYDLGGGTLDVTVIRAVGGQLEVLGTGGDAHLGGGDFDDRIVDWMLERLSEKYPSYTSALTNEQANALRVKLKLHAEAGKIKLCESQDADARVRFQIPVLDRSDSETIAFDETLTMPQFEGLIDDLLQRSLELIDVAMEAPANKLHLTEKDVTAVLPVGGGTHIPAVRRLLEKRFGVQRVRGSECGIDPLEAVALGAAVVAADFDPETDEVAKRVLVDVTGRTLGIVVRDARTGREELCSVIRKDTPLPCSGWYEFTVPVHRQEPFQIPVYMGEGMDSRQVNLIGECEITLPPSKEAIRLQVEFDLDGNGVLVVRVTECITGGRVQYEFQFPKVLPLSPEDLQRRLKALEGMLNDPLDRAIDENVQFTVFRPRTVRPEEWYDLVAAVHREENRPDAPASEPTPIEKVKQKAQQILGRAIEDYAQNTQDGQGAIPHGGCLTFCPEIEHVEFNPSRQTVRRLEDEQTITFRMNAARKLDGQTARGRMSVFLGAILVAEIPLQIRVDSGHVAKSEGQANDPVSASPYRKIFASYSRRDTAIVQQFAWYARAMGDEFLLDCTALRSGETWNKRLMELIEEADVFQLFWSKESMDSSFVRQEWEYALDLRRQGRKRLEFIRPVFWEDPLPKNPPDLPPPELEAIQFHRLSDDEKITHKPDYHCNACGFVLQAKFPPFSCPNCNAKGKGFYEAGHGPARPDQASSPRRIDSPAAAASTTVHSPPPPSPHPPTSELHSPESGATAALVREYESLVTAGASARMLLETLRLIVAAEPGTAKWHEKLRAMERATQDEMLHQAECLARQDEEDLLARTVLEFQSTRWHEPPPQRVVLRMTGLLSDLQRRNRLLHQAECLARQDEEDLLARTVLEFQSTRWHEPPPQRVVLRMTELLSDLQRRNRWSLEQLVRELENAYQERDVERGRRVRSQWDACRKVTRISSTDILVQASEAALAWLANADYKENRRREHHEREARLIRALDEGAPLIELDRYFAALWGLGEGIDESLSKRYQSRRIIYVRNRRLILVALAVAALAAIAWVAHLIHAWWASP